MAPPKGHKWYGGSRVRITENTPLTPKDWKFISAYVRAETESYDTIGKISSEKIRDTNGYSRYVSHMLSKPNVKKTIEKLMEERTKKTIAEANEVMEYFTAVMRGEVKDQFGLDAPLTERTNAAKELAKRTVDVELRKQGLADNQVNININWGDPFSLPDMVQPQEPVGITFSEEGGDEDE